MENLYDKRKVYDKAHLLEEEVDKNPMDLFQHWMSDAEEDTQIAEANAMSVATIEDDACPRTRMVLLKSYSDEGFIFYTNYKSRKGRALAERPVACLHFFWPSLERQVIIKAKLSKTSAANSDEYFHARPIGSQLGALASPQSTEIPDRKFLEDNLQNLQHQFEGKEVQRPDYWGGYLAQPYEIEFWQGRPNRLHDRILYTFDEEKGWKITRLAP